MMNQQEMIQSLRAEIAKLQEVIDLLIDQPSGDKVRRPGRPKGSGTKATSFNPQEFAPKKRTMSPEGKARIAAAQKKRWAAQKSAAIGRSKLARKVMPAAAKKSSRAGKKSSSTQAHSQSASAKSTAAMARKSTGKKSVTKGISEQATKRPMKQVDLVAPEAQTTA